MKMSMRALLARKEDKHIGCIKCGSVHAIIRVGSNGARYRCEHCSRDGGEMQKEIATRLLTVLAFWPEAQKTTFRVTDVDPYATSLGARRKAAKGRAERVNYNVQEDDTQAQGR